MTDRTTEEIARSVADQWWPEPPCAPDHEQLTDDVLRAIREARVPLEAEIAELRAEREKDVEAMREAAHGLAEIDAALWSPDAPDFRPSKNWLAARVRPVLGALRARLEAPKTSEQPR